MANNYLKPFLLFINVLLQLWLVKCKTGPLAPALYIFGDSLSDSGNNNVLNTSAKANHKPYGIDFPSGVTGRFTNGKTFVDFVAESLGLPLAPPFLGTRDKTTFATGVNYASGSAGILPETGTKLGQNVNFNRQIMYFRSTTKDPSTLSKAIFIISIGSNDYINNYLQPTNYKSNKQYTPQKFADILIKGLKQGIKVLYSLGARKFVVFNIGRLGCMPAIVTAAKTRPTPACIEDVNNLVLLYNTKFPSAIRHLEKILHGTTFIHGDVYQVGKSSAEAGGHAVQTGCCKMDVSGMCVPNSIPCAQRAAHQFYDAFHPSEAVNRVMAENCFGGSLCVPINIQKLARKK